MIGESSCIMYIHITYYIHTYLINKNLLTFKVNKLGYILDRIKTKTKNNKCYSIYYLVFTIFKL